MNYIDVVSFLARAEGRKLKYDSFDKQLPFFTLNKNKVTNYENYKSHDNAPRMKYFTDVISNYVMPHMYVDINSSFAIELHDSNSYLTNGYDYDNCLVWARNKNDTKSILIPDMYQLYNYNNKLNSYKDNIVFNSKPINKIGFYGSTTGDRNPLGNSRIDYSMWSIGNRDIIDCYITNVVQMSNEDFMKHIPEYNLLKSEFKSLAELYNYKYLLDIPGNTYSWDRVPMILNSNSLLFKTNCSDYGWYYPMLHEGTHYVHVDKDNMRNKKLYYDNNPNEANFIIQSANIFAKKFLNASTAYLYLKHLFDECQFWNSP